MAYHQADQRLVLLGKRRKPCGQFGDNLTCAGKVMPLHAVAGHVFDPCEGVERDCLDDAVLTLEPPVNATHRYSGSLGDIVHRETATAVADQNVDCTRDDASQRNAAALLLRGEDKGREVEIFHASPSPTELRCQCRVVVSGGLLSRWNRTTCRIPQ